MPRILLTGAGSSGHAFPLMAVAEELQKQASQNGADLTLSFAGDAKLFRKISYGTGIKTAGILSPKWRRYASAENFLDIFKAPVGFLQSLILVWWFMPDLIFSKGGYDSFLPVFVGRIFMIPVVIHDSDAIPGKANLWAGKWAKKIFISFEGAKSYFQKSDRVELVGNPIRNGILTVTERATAVLSFNLDPAKPVVLITGASQGAKTINDVLLLALVGLTKKFQVIHQCGPKNYDEVNAAILKIVQEGGDVYGKAIADNYRLYPFFDLEQMALAYSASDVVVSRAGAAAIFEVAARSKPSVVIPLKSSASDHQLANAREFSKFGAVAIEEDNLTPNLLINEIENAYENRIAISEKIKQFAKPLAAQTTAQKISEMLIK